MAAAPGGSAGPQLSSIRRHTHAPHAPHASPPLPHPPQTRTRQPHTRPPIRAVAPQARATTLWGCTARPWKTTSRRWRRRTLWTRAVPPRGSWCRWVQCGVQLGAPGAQCGVLGSLAGGAGWLGGVAAGYLHTGDGWRGWLHLGRVAGRLGSGGSRTSPHAPPPLPPSPPPSTCHSAHLLACLPASLPPRSSSAWPSTKRRWRCTFARTWTGVCVCGCVAVAVAVCSHGRALRCRLLWQLQLLLLFAPTAPAPPAPALLSSHVLSFCVDADLHPEFKVWRWGWGTAVLRYCGAGWPGVAPYTACRLPPIGWLLSISATNARTLHSRLQELWCKKGPPSGTFVSMYRAIMQVQAVLLCTSSCSLSSPSALPPRCAAPARTILSATAAVSRSPVLCPLPARLQPQHPNWSAPKPPPPPAEQLGLLLEAADAVGKLVQYSHQVPHSCRSPCYTHAAGGVARCSASVHSGCFCGTVCRRVATFQTFPVPTLSHLLSLPPPPAGLPA